MKIKHQKVQVGFIYIIRLTILGTFINGSNLIINKFYPHLQTRQNSNSNYEYGISYKLYKVFIIFNGINRMG